MEKKRNKDSRIGDGEGRRGEDEEYTVKRRKSSNERNIRHSLNNIELPPPSPNIKSNQMDSDVAEKDPTGRYIRYYDTIGSHDDAVFKQYKAFDESKGLEVAWIQVSIDDQSISCDQLCEKINLLKSLRHENVVKFHHSWIDHKYNRINIVMESFASGSLREYRTKHSTIDIKVIRNWARQILRGLHYLHTHNPPLFLQDFTCDQVFVNGNNGQVKIGTHFGLAVLDEQQQATDDQNNVYCFGICLLEMITCENPYTEPSILSGVSDPRAKHLIEACLSPSSMKLSATDLLEHPFLAAQSCKEIVSSSQLSDPICKQVSSKLPVVNDMKDKKKKIVQRASSSKKTNLWYGLRGMQIDERTILFTLDVVNKAASSGVPQKIEYPYHIDSDTTVTVAAEMIQQLDFLGQDVAIVVHLIDAVVSDIVGCSNNEAIRQHLYSTTSSDHASSNKLIENTLSLSEPDELKVQLDTIDMRYVKRCQRLLKNMSFI